MRTSKVNSNKIDLSGESIPLSPGQKLKKVAMSPVRLV